VQPEKIAHLLTAEEAFWLNPCDRWELVDGRVVEMSPTKKRHGRILMRLGRRLEEHVQRHQLGEIYAGDVGFILRRNPDTVRAPDLAFIRRERLPAVEEETFSSVMPDLAIEILSPSDRWGAVEQKIAEYLSAGVASVWAVDPSREELRVYRPGQVSVTLGKDDQIEDPALLPGLKLQVAALFSD
jgi:Uma2 family endonuclease